MDLLSKYYRYFKYVKFQRLFILIN